MSILISSIITILGLALFEVVSSIDNAVINAEVLSTMRPRARKWFLLWGFLLAVVVIRGVLPWLIVWMAAPTLGPMGALTATFHGGQAAADAISKSAPVLLVGGGTFLCFLFFSWLFLEEKEFGFGFEKYVQQYNIWFYAVVAIFLTLLVKRALHQDTLLAMGAVIGSTTFFVLHGFRQNAEEQEKKLASNALSDVSKLLYLEIIDAVFSVDGVLGAFAFTLSVPLILIGNGIGAFVVRRLTVSNISTIKKYKFLKNGAMYSILALGGVMLFDGFGADFPQYISPLITVGIVGYFFYKSVKQLGPS